MTFLYSREELLQSDPNHSHNRRNFLHHTQHGFLSPSPQLLKSGSELSSGQLMMTEGDNLVDSSKPQSHHHHHSHSSIHQVHRLRHQQSGSPVYPPPSIMTESTTTASSSAIYGSQVFVALYDFHGVGEEKLSLKKGDQV